MIRNLERADLMSLAERFAYNKPDPVVLRSSALSPADFLTICDWKSERRRDLSRKNAADDIERISGAAFASADAQIQVSVLSALHGVRIPTASALLHWGFKEGPIIDFRAWWTVFEEERKSFDGPAWGRFSARMWAEANHFRMNIRELDKAVWQYSLENQPT